MQAKPLMKAIRCTKSEGNKRNETNVNENSTSPRARGYGHYRYEKVRGKKEMNLTSDPPVQAPVCTNKQPIDKGAKRKEKSRKQTVFDTIGGIAP